MMVKTLSGLAGLLLTTQLFAQMVPVTVIPLGEVWTSMPHDAPAEVIALQRSSLSAGIAARVEQVLADTGDTVRAGEILMQLECESFRLQREISRSELQSRRVQLDFARGQWERAQNLEKKQSISEELYDQRRLELEQSGSAVKMLQQQVALAEEKVDECDIKAPYSGVITRRLVSAGDYVISGQPVMDLLDPSRVELEVKLISSDVISVIQVDSLLFRHAGEVYPVKLKTLLPEYDATAGTAAARLLFTGNRLPWPGSSGRLNWQTAQRLLPAQYLVRRQQQLGVFLVDGNQSRFHPLPNAREGRAVQLDLPADTLVIVEGRHRLVDGDAIRIINE